MNYVAALLIFVCQEFVALVVFPILNRYLGVNSANPWWNRTAILKGVLERLVLFTALTHNYPQMLIALGAMKLGTRLHEEKGLEISNTYFLVGNLLSMLLAIASSVIAKAI